LQVAIFIKGAGRRGGQGGGYLPDRLTGGNQEVALVGSCRGRKGDWGTRKKPIGIKGDRSIRGRRNRRNYQSNLGREGNKKKKSFQEKAQ